ncbi:MULTISPECIES: hypothetical protein [Prochlorococcus]|uniref:hypothetical protein n=1 Tax=Prochlorococcus TaxID=1218 RepID=UPI0007B38D43|nr:hypothetical protein [Prochlorococcus marinus]
MDEDNEFDEVELNEVALAAVSGSGKGKLTGNDSYIASGDRSYCPPELAEARRKEMIRNKMLGSLKTLSDTGKKIK